MQQASARVLGVTSRGLFLLASPQRIIFISVERYRSPMTINVDRSCDRWRTIDVGAAAQFSDARLIFPSIDFSISLSEEVVWHCPLPVAATDSFVEQVRVLHAIAAGVQTRQGNDGLSALLPTLLSWSDTPLLSSEQSALFDRLIALRRVVHMGDDSALLAGLIGLLGQGRGLTPSGDDVAVGLLLMLTRSPRVNSPSDRENRLKHVAPQLVAEAYHRTTSISANLIECAASGQGDERLITVVDNIVSGSTFIDDCVEYVLGWGASSGIDTLVGMAVGL